MATVKGVNKTLVDAGGVATIGRGLVDGRVKCMLDSYTLTTGNLAGDVIKLGGTLPAGANVVGIMLAVSAAQSSLTYMLGDGATANRYKATGATGLQTAVVPVWHTGLNYVVGTATSDNVIQLTTEAATATAGVLYAAIFYTQD